MKIKVVIVIILVIALSSLVFLGAKNATATIPLAWEDMPENSNPNLKYFGVYHFDPYIEEVGALGIFNIAKTDAKNINLVEDLINAGMQVFIMTRKIFYQAGGVHPDWEENWETAKAQLAPFMDNIIGFYVDEPYLTGKSKEAFHLNCQVVKADFPDKKMMAIMSLQGLNGADSDYFEHCTDIGYDLYLPWNKEAVLGHINQMKNKFAYNSQDIWLVPKAFYTVEKDYYALVEDRKLAPGDDIISWIKGSYEIAVEDPQIVGIYPFVYDNKGFDLTLRDFIIEDSENYREDIRQLYLQIGGAIINNN